MMFEEKKNLIVRFDEDKLSVGESEKTPDRKRMWYDITPIVKHHANETGASVVEYLEKVEADLGYFYDGEDYMWEARTSFKEMVLSKSFLLGCVREDEGLRIHNDGVRIRLTFLNGSVMEVSNSEWGSILLG